ncbi:MAG TPA: DUF87 domain-containing protein [Ktedonobacteraceae bacterium]|nr:DUF87 domain-containing protein [Ktedonobacteraceae bacterium]
MKPLQLNEYVPRVVLGNQLPSKEPFILVGDSLAQHKLISGITGQGKSRFIASIVVQLLNEGIPFALIDPHSDLCDTVLRTLIASGFYEDARSYEKLWYVDFSRNDAYLPFNVLQQPYPPHQVASNLLEGWKRAWSAIAEGNAVNLENVLEASAYTLIVNERPLTNISRFLSDQAFRAGLLANVTDSHITEFFHTRFDTWSRGKASSLSESTLRRAFLLTFEPSLRYTLGQKENKLNFRQLMDNKTSLLLDLGNLDAQTQRFLGCLITIGIEQAALSRANSQNRSPYHFIIDEFSQFCAQTGDSLERMLTLTRKFGLSVGMACQTLSQTKDIKDALQNCLHITFKLGYDDATTVAPRLIDNTTAKRSLWQQLFSSEQPLVDDGQKRTEWTQLVKNLDPQECLLHMSGKTFKLRTLTVPDPPLPGGALAHVKAVYAKQLLTPIKNIVLVEDVPAQAAPVPLQAKVVPLAKKQVQAQPTPQIAPQPATPRSSRRRVQVDNTTA